MTSLSTIEKYTWATSNKDKFDQFVVRFSGDVNLKQVYGIHKHTHIIRADEMCISKYVIIIYFRFLCFNKYKGYITC